MFNSNNYSNTSAREINTKRILWYSLPEKEKEKEKENFREMNESSDTIPTDENIRERMKLDYFNSEDFDNLYVKFKIKSVRKYGYKIYHDTTISINNFTLEDENTNVFNIMIMDDSLRFGYNGSIYKFNRQSNKYIRIDNIADVNPNDETLFYYAFEKTSVILPTGGRPRRRSTFRQRSLKLTAGKSPRATRRTRRTRRRV